MKTPQEKMNMCDICGDLGVEEAILTCSRCKINCEHMYCMKVLLEEVVDDWTCDECKLFLRSEPRVPSFPGEESQSNSVKMGKSVELPSEIKKLQNESRVGSGSGNWEKRVEKGKTKYLSVQEAIQLSTGEKNSSAPVKWRSKSKEPNVGASVFEKTAIRRKIVPLNFSCQQDLASGSLQQPRPHRSGNMEIREKQVQRFTKPMGSNIHATKVRSGDAKKMNAVVLPYSEKPSYSPAFDALWKSPCIKLFIRGSFRIQDDHKQEELNLQIKAHPPSRVRKKIYEFSKKMPEKLHFQLVCAKTFWNILFYEDNPDERNIALYFFPSDSGRSEDYICLMESFSLRDLALRKQIEDIELLVFTSKRLPLNFQSLNGKYFLWGIFHRVKNDPSTGFFVPPSNEPHDHVSDREEVDMDVDMIGGIEVGKFNVRVENEPPRELTVSPPIFYGPQQQTAAPRPIYGPVNTAPLLNVKMEPSDLSVPPGFEDVYKLRKEGLSSLNVGDQEEERRESDGDPSSSGK